MQCLCPRSLSEISWADQKGRTRFIGHWQPEQQHHCWTGHSDTPYIHLSGLLRRSILFSVMSLPPGTSPSSACSISYGFMSCDIHTHKHTCKHIHVTHNFFTCLTADQPVMSHCIVGLSMRVVDVWLTCLTCQVPLRSSFWLCLNDGSLDACEEATFCVRQEPAADRPLSWWSARAARPHCAWCQDRPLPFTSTNLYSWCWHVGFGYTTWSPTTYPQHVYIQDFTHSTFLHFLHHTFTHTSVPHNSFTHNSLTHSCPRNTCTRNAFTSTPAPYRSFTNSTLTHDSSPHTTSTHRAFTHTRTHFFHQQHL